MIFIWNIFFFFRLFLSFFRFIVVGLLGLGGRKSWLFLVLVVFEVIILLEGLSNVNFKLDGKFVVFFLWGMSLKDSVMFWFFCFCLILIIRINFWLFNLIIFFFLNEIDCFFLDIWLVFVFFFCLFEINIFLG